MVESDENPQVTVKHILKATSSMFGTSSKDRMKDLELNPKVVLVILALLDKSIEYQLVYDAFKACFKSAGLSAITSSEFQDLVSQLDGMGLLVVNKKKNAKILSLNNGNRFFIQGLQMCLVRARGKPWLTIWYLKAFPKVDGPNVFTI